MDVYGSAEYGRVTVGGGGNRVRAPGPVQVGCAVDVPIPIVNTTRHSLRYQVNTFERRWRPAGSAAEIRRRPASGPENGSGYGDGSDYEDGSGNEDGSGYGDEGETGGGDETERGRRASSGDGNRTAAGENSTGFEFRPAVGRLAPNETRRLCLSFRPAAGVPCAADAECRLTCDDFPGIVTVVPVTVEGDGCDGTRFEVRNDNNRHKTTVANSSVVNVPRAEGWGTVSLKYPRLE